MEEKNTGLLKIAVTGPESTGKSTLCEALAAHFDTHWVPEYAREYLSELKRKYNYGDLELMARQQLFSEQMIMIQAKEEGKKFIFCDTEPINFAIWSEIQFSRSEPWIETMVEDADYSFYLLLAPDLPWEADEFRENPHNREEIFGMFEDGLKKNNRPYAVIRGDHEERLIRAVAAVEKFLWA